MGGDDTLHELRIMLEQEQMEFVTSQLAVFGLFLGIAEFAPSLEAIKSIEILLIHQHRTHHGNQLADRVVRPNLGHSYIP